MWIFIFGIFLSGCTAPTYPKEKVQDAIAQLCRKEYKVDVDTKVTGNTVAVYLPAENLFDAMLNLDREASKKINDVIMGVSRVALSTDAKFEFYIVITQDPHMPEVEIVYIRYVDDVKKFLWGGMSRDEYSKRAIVAIKTPPQAERERVLRELFSRLHVQNIDEVVQQYLQPDQPISAIAEISYWNKKFFIKEIGLGEFLASQISERVKIEFRLDKDIVKWYELKASDGAYVAQPGEAAFVFNINIADRVAPLYLDSGMEWGVRAKRLLVFKKFLGIAGSILWAYKFDDFDGINLALLGENRHITKGQLFDYKKGKAKIEDLI